MAVGISTLGRISSVDKEETIMLRCRVSLCVLLVASSHWYNDIEIEIEIQVYLGK